MVKPGVIIPTRNASRYLPTLVWRLRQQTQPISEILIIDSSSRDDTAILVQQLGCRLITIKADSFRHGATRNRGALEVIGDPLVFMTQDALPANDEYLVQLIRPIVAGQASATFARQMPRPEASPLERIDRTYHYPDCAGVATTEIRRYYFSDAASAVSRAAFLAVGGFPPDTPSAEDRILSAKLQRQGHAVRYVPEAEVIHSHGFAMGEYVRRYFDFGAATQMAGSQSGARGLGGEGGQYLVAVVKELYRQAQLRTLPYALMQMAAKGVGYRLGLSHRRLPAGLKAALGVPAWWRHGLSEWRSDDPLVVEAGRVATGARAGRSQAGA